MATALVHPPLTLGASTKGHHHDDALAHIIQEDFVRRVDPRELMIFLPPHNLLTTADEERIRTRQEQCGRTAGAQLMLQLLSRRGDWLPTLLQGLRHTGMGLADLADVIEQRLREVRIEMEMEVDADEVVPDTQPWPPADDLGLPPQLSAILGGLRRQGLTDKDVAQYERLVIIDMARSFFTESTLNLEELKCRCEYFERIANILTTSAAIGCLELRMRVKCSRDLHALRKLIEGGAVRDALEKGFLSSKWRSWLVDQAAQFGLRWRQMALKVTVREDDLDKVETFLRVKEEYASPTSAAQALLLKTAEADGDADCRATRAQHVRSLPSLLLDFLSWLLVQHPDLAHDVVHTLSQLPLEEARGKTLQACADYFNLDRNKHRVDLEYVGKQMIEAYDRGEFPTYLAFKITAEGEACDPRKLPHVEATPGSDLLERLKTLQESGLVVPIEARGGENTFTFKSPFVADFALSLAVRTTPGLLPSAIQLGSQFLVLHLVELVTVGSLLRDELVLPLLKRPAVEWLLSFPLAGETDIMKSFPITLWAKYSAQLKKKLPILKAIDMIDGIPLLSVQECDVKTQGLLQHVVTAQREVDLAGKLTHLSENQLRAVLVCVQFSNSARVTLADENDWVTLKLAKVAAVGTLQPAMKLGKNRLENWHVQCLVEAMPGMESVVHFDMSGCTLTSADRDLLLSAMHVDVVQELILSSMPLTVGERLPGLSHLRRLRVLDLTSTGLRDDHMQWLASQLLQLSDLRELTLDHNVITTLGLSRLTPVLGSRHTLRVLRLAYCNLDAGAAYVLGCLLAAARDLHVLSLSNCRLLDSGLQHLSQALQDHVRLTRISLRSGNYSPAGMAPFLAHLAKCTRMQHLELGECPLAEEMNEAAHRLTAALAASGHWDYLGLWKCQLGATPFMEQLSTLTWQLRGVSRLILQDNGLTDAHLKQLAEAIHLGVFRYLRHLNLRQNAIGETGACELADVLGGLPYLQELLLQHSNIPAEAAQRLALAALPMPAMTTLDLSDSYGIEPLEGRDILFDIAQRVQEGNVILKAVEMNPEEQEREFKILSDASMMGLTPGEAKLADVKLHAGAAQPAAAEEALEEDVEVEKPVEEKSDEIAMEDKPGQETKEDKPDGDAERVEPGAGTRWEKATESAAVTPGRRMRRTAEISGDQVVIDGKLYIILGQIAW